MKPGNVLLDAEGPVKVTDFGIATAMLAVDELSDQGILLGTAKYVAPEQVQGHLVDGRTDLYSLAIVLYECLTGVVPFDGPDERSVALPACASRHPHSAGSGPTRRRARPPPGDDAAIPAQRPPRDHRDLRSRPQPHEPRGARRTGAAGTARHDPPRGGRRHAAYPVDNTPPFGTAAPAAADRRRARSSVTSPARPPRRCSGPTSAEPAGRSADSLPRRSSPPSS